MTLDLATLLAANTTASLALALPILFVAQRDRVHPGLTLWACGLLMLGLSYPAFGLRAIGWTRSSIVATNLFTGLTLVMHTRAIGAFQHDRIKLHHRWLVWLPFALNMALAILLLHNDYWRNIGVVVCQTCMTLMLLREAWAPGMPERRLTGRWVLIGGASLLSLALLARLLFIALSSNWDRQYNVPGHVQASTYFVVMAVVLINSMGFVLMQMERAVDQQRMLATHDALTGLYNRSALQSMLPHCAAQSRRHNAPLGFLMLDIDHFKHINDEYGHLAGDEVLKTVAQRVCARMRQSDILARFGGEEFLAILPNTNKDGAMHLAEAVRQAIAAHPIILSATGQTIAMTISIGVHVGQADDGHKALEKMIGQSDQALYVAKNAGRNCVRYCA